MPESKSFDRTRPRIAMVSTHGYVAAEPPLGAADTGGQVVYVLELSKKLAQLGFEVDIWTRRFGSQPEMDIVNSHVRVIRMPCGGPDFIMKEYLHEHLMEWCENALRFIKRHRLAYQFIDSHYWDAGVAGQRLSEALGVPHVHTPHSLGAWKKSQMEHDYPARKSAFEKEDLGISIMKILRHPRLANRLSRMGAHKARSLFTWTGIAQQLISLVEGRPAPGAFEDSDWDEPWNDGD